MRMGVPVSLLSQTFQAMEVGKEEELLKIGFYMTENKSRVIRMEDRKDRKNYLTWSQFIVSGGRG